ncbi:MAG: LAGLIDADG family homing endonuclease [Phenylobacterium sp.]
MYNYNEVFNSCFKYFDTDLMAVDSYINKYIISKDGKEFLEINPDDMFWRIAKELARVEQNKFKKPFTVEEIYNFIKDFARIIPQGSSIAGIGNDLQYTTLSNCYVVPSPDDSYGSILMADQRLVQISKRRGGTGLDISNLRPNGSPTTNSAKTSTGIIPFLQRYSNSIEEVGQGGRRGALMISLSVHHPEILDFVNIKLNTQKVTGANMSVRLTNEFLLAVEEDREYEQRWPVDSKNPKISKMVRAKDVWDTIIKCAHACAEPGLLFWDNIINESPADCYSDVGFKTISTNPCVTSDTWVMTSDGPRMVSDLIGKRFNAVVNGKSYSSSEDGFFFTGNKQTLAIKSRKGYEFKCTPEHLVKVCNHKERNKLTYQWKKAADLTKGDLLCLNEIRNNITWEADAAGCSGGNFNDGWLHGYLLGDGCLSKIQNHSDVACLDFWGEEGKQIKAYAKEMIKYSNLITRSDCGSGESTNNVVRIKSTNLAKVAMENGIDSDKDISCHLEYNSSDFYRGFLRGWFDADGSVSMDNYKGSYNARLTSYKVDNLKIAQRMLLRLGIVCSIYENRRDDGFRAMPDGKGGSKEYYCHATHELVISRDNLVVFMEKVGFGCKNKNDKLKEIVDGFSKGPYKEYFIDEVASIEQSGAEDVYDATIDDVHQFDANGVLVHNCAELPLSAFDSCRLLAINLFYYVVNPFTKDAYFDYEQFYKDAQVAQRFMDDIVDLELEAVDRIINKINNDPEDEFTKMIERDIWEKIRNSCKNGRRTGTGITALGDVLAALNIKYASDESFPVVDKIFRTLKLGCYRSSVDMAKELGAFDVWDFEKEKDNDYLLRIRDEDPILYNDMSKYGRRNIGLLTCAPVGTISIMARTSSGFEPVFNLMYQRKRKINPEEQNARVDVVDDKGVSYQLYDVIHPKLLLWMEVTGEKDIEKSPWFGSCSMDINWVNKVKLQSIAQRHIDHSISNCITPDSLIETNKGLLYFDELTNLDEIPVDSFVENIEDTKVLNHEMREVNVNEYYNNGIKPVFSIRLLNGLEIECTSNEKFLVLNDETRVEEWKKLSEIEEGDKVKIKQI